MAAELGKVRVGNLTGTLILRMDDGSEVEVGSLSVPVDVHVGVTMPASAPSADDYSVGDYVEVIDPDTMRELQGKTGMVVSPELRPDLAAGQVLVYIDEYTSGREDRAWSFEPSALKRIG